MAAELQVPILQTTVVVLLLTDHLILPDIFLVIFFVIAKLSIHVPLSN